MNRGIDSSVDNKSNRQVFAGITIAGFSWAMVGPLTMKLFADYGATVIRVETSRRPCVSRTSPPYKDGKPGLNRSGYFNHFSANMYSMAMNMTHPSGIEVAKKLIANSDVVMENFTPGVMEKWGLGYDELRKIKQDIIVLRQSGFGTGGAYEDLSAFGMILSAIAGIPNFIGWPDREPLPVGVGAYTDCISPRYAAAALIAALDYREKTGRGQLIELAQFETAISFILPAILDYVANEREPVRLGNACPHAVPHGVYACKGTDTWCTIAVFNDEQWAQLCKVTGKSEWYNDSRFNTLVNRKSNEEILNRLLSEWTRQFTAEEIMVKLQAAGVPGGVVHNAAGVFGDPQLRERNLFWALPHSEVGSFTHLGTGFELSKTPAQPRSPSPGLGEHTEYVCTKLLGLTDEEFIALLQEGVFE
jgi:crotonobetainyl-CoA:carnitine CoA-transferase CaiB-like acyl-CoA transferase